MLMTNAPLGSKEPTMNKILSAIAALALAAVLAAPGLPLDGGAVLNGGGSTVCCRQAI